VVKIVSFSGARSLLRGLAGSLVVLSVVVGVGSSSASSKKPVVKRRPVPKAVAKPPVTKVVSSPPVVKDPLGRDYCGDAKVVLRVPVTTIPCQIPLPDEQLATKEALLAAYENYWIAETAAAREPRIGKFLFQRILIADAYNLSTSNNEIEIKEGTYWDGTRADIQLLNTRIRSLTSRSAKIEDCVTRAGVGRTHPNGQIIPGTERIDREEIQLLAANINGVWLFTRVTVSDDGSIDSNSKCTATDS
jgi:hypothetical protein